MSMFQVSALASRSRTSSLNFDSHDGRLNDIIEENYSYSSSLPNRQRSHTLDIHPKQRTMSVKEMLDNFYNDQQRRSSTGVAPRRSAPPPPRPVSLPNRGSPPLYPDLNEPPPEFSSLALSPPRPGTFSIRGATGVQPSTAAAQDGPETLNLVHIDFVPKDAFKDSKEDTENFLDLIQKANSWLEHNPDIRIVTAETVAWTTPEKAQLFTDGAVSYKCMTSGKTKRVQGLRVWYVASGDKFWLNAGPKQQIGFRDYLPGKDNGISAAVNQLNEDMRTKPISGKVLRVETMHALQDTVTDNCVQKMNLDSNRKYFSFIRLIYLDVDGMAPIKAKIGLNDFIPKLNDRSPHSEGYESFQDLHGRAARWIYKQNNTRIINLQTVPVKVKKEDSQEKLQNISIWESSAFTEHGDKKTDYLKILRVVFLRFLKPAEQENLTYKLTTRVFTPRPVEPRDNTQDGGVTDRTFEDLQTLEGRVNAWLVKSGARLLSLETISSRCLSVDTGMSGRDLTFHSNQRDKNNPVETWIKHFRLYLDGNYRNVPEDEV